MACDAAHEEKENNTPKNPEARQRHEPNTRTTVASAPVHTILAAQEHVIRSRIDRFIAGYGLTPMGKAVALNWIQVMKGVPLETWRFRSRPPSLSILACPIVLTLCDGIMLFWLYQ